MDREGNLGGSPLAPFRYFGSQLGRGRVLTFPSGKVYEKGKKARASQEDALGDTVSDFNAQGSPQFDTFGRSCLYLLRAPGFVDLNIQSYANTLF